MYSFFHHRFFRRCFLESVHIGILAEVYRKNDLQYVDKLSASGKALGVDICHRFRPYFDKRA